MEVNINVDFVEFMMAAAFERAMKCSDTAVDTKEDKD
jgi:hypothetical protein